MTKDWIVKERPPEASASSEAGEALPKSDGTDRTEQPTMMRFNLGKRKLSLVPASFGDYTAAVLEYGAMKYSANNWRKGGCRTRIRRHEVFRQQLAEGRQLV